MIKKEKKMIKEELKFYKKSINNYLNKEFYIYANALIKIERVLNNNMYSKNVSSIVSEINSDVKKLLWDLKGDLSSVQVDLHKIPKVIVKDYRFIKPLIYYFDGLYERLTKLLESLFIDSHKSGKNDLSLILKFFQKESSLIYKEHINVIYTFKFIFNFHTKDFKKKEVLGCIGPCHQRIDNICTALNLNIKRI
jgi:hypothetical protein